MEGGGVSVAPVDPLKAVLSKLTSRALVRRGRVGVGARRQASRGAAVVSQAVLRRAGSDPTVLGAQHAPSTSTRRRLKDELRSVDMRMRSQSYALACGYRTVEDMGKAVKRRKEARARKAAARAAAAAAAAAADDDDEADDEAGDEEDANAASKDSGSQHGGDDDDAAAKTSTEQPQAIGSDGDGATPPPPASPLVATRPFDRSASRSASRFASPSPAAAPASAAPSPARAPAGATPGAAAVPSSSHAAADEAAPVVPDADANTSGAIATAAAAMDTAVPTPSTAEAAASVQGRDSGDEADAHEARGDDDGSDDDADTKPTSGPRNSAYRNMVLAEMKAAKAQASRKTATGALVANEAEEDDEEELEGFGQYGVKGTKAARLFAGAAATQDDDEEEAEGDDVDAAELEAELDGIVDDLSADEEDGVDMGLLAQLRDEEDKKALRTLQRKVRDGFSADRRGRGRFAGVAALARSDSDDDSEDEELQLDRLERERQRRQMYNSDTNDSHAEGSDVGAAGTAGDGDGKAADAADDVDSEDDWERQMLDAQKNRMKRNNALRQASDMMEQSKARLLDKDADSQMMLQALVRTNTRCPSINTLVRTPSLPGALNRTPSMSPSPVGGNLPSPAAVAGGAPRAVKSAFSVGLGLDRAPSVGPVAPTLKRSRSFIGMTMPGASPTSLTPNAAAVMQVVSSNTRFVFTADNSHSRLASDSLPPSTPTAQLSTPKAGSGASCGGDGGGDGGAGASGGGSLFATLMATRVTKGEPPTSAAKRQKS